MIPSIRCYMPPSIERLGPTTPSFQTRIHDAPIFQTRLTPLLRGTSQGLNIDVDAKQPACALSYRLYLRKYQIIFFRCVSNLVHTNMYSVLNYSYLMHGTIISIQ